MNKENKSVYTTNPKGGCWPTREQGLLLRASLLQGREAINAWHEWKSKVEIDRLDQGSLRLLPLLYHNLHIQGIEDPLVKRFKGIYRLTWYKNQMLFHNMATILRSFHNAGIQTMILKGAALVLLHYRDYGLRPMNDFDVLVHTEQASEAINLLTNLDWTPKPKLWRPLENSAETYFFVTNAYCFKNAAGCELDLHWHLLPECCYAGADNDFWECVVSAKIHDVSTYILNPTDQLLHVCVHGAKWNPVSPFRWAADAMMIINASQSEIDWDRLIKQAQKRRLILPLKETLNYLREVLDAPIPLAILQAIKNMPISKIEHLEYKSRSRPFEQAGPLWSLWLLYLQYSRVARGASLMNKLVGFPKFLHHLWRTSNMWQVPFYAAFKCLGGFVK